MNDTIVKALIEAAAIFAQFDKRYNRSQIKNYFDQNDSTLEVPLLIKQFENYVDHYQSINKLEDLGSVETEIESRISFFCQKLLSDLVKHDRAFFFISLIELLKGDQSINSNLKEFLYFLADGLKIDPKDSHNLVGFSDFKGLEPVLSSDFLLVTNHSNDLEEELEGAWVDKNKPKDAITNFLLVQPDLDGDLVFLKLHHFSFFVFTYLGESPILLNHHKIISGKLYVFSPEDTIVITEKVRLNFQSIRSVFRNEHFGAKLFFEGKNICSKTSRTKKSSHEIKPFSFAEESGNLVCIVGPKHTTNRITTYLSGASMSYSGDLSLNKYNYKTEYYKIQKLVGVATSSPVFDSNLSVYDNIYLITKLFHFNSDSSKIKIIVSEIIERFHLLEIQDRYIKDKKTDPTYPLYKCLLNLACVSVCEPHVLFVDSILDDLSVSDSEYILQILRKESASDRLIFITQTELNSSVFKYADRLWLFDEQGYIIFNSVPKEAYSHFLSYHRKTKDLDEYYHDGVNLNPDQITQLIHQKSLDHHGMSTLTRKVSPKEWNRYFVEKVSVKMQEDSFKKGLPVNNINTPSITSQFGLFIGKIIKSNINSIRSTSLFLLITAILAISVGLIFRNDWGGTYYFGLNPNIHLYYITTIVVIFILGFIRGFVDTQKEKFTFFHLSFKNISSISYINALLVWLLIYSAIISIVFALFGKFILGMHGMLLKYFFVYFTIGLLSNIIGVLLSISKRNVYKTYQIFIAILCFNLVFSGVFIEFKNLPRNLVSSDKVPVLAEFSPFRWAFESLVVDQVKNNNFEKIFYDTDNGLENSYFAANYLIPELQVQLNHLNGLQNPYRDKMIKAIGTEISLFPNIYSNLFPFEYINDLKVGKISSVLINETLDYLTYTQLQLFDRIRELTEIRKKLEKRVTDSLGKANYQKFALENNNLFLKNYLNNNTSVNKVGFNGEYFVKSLNPIFLQPQSNYGKAHLFAPLKRYNGYYYESLWFNLLVLSIFVFILYTILLMVSQKTGSLIMKN